jgi:predicted permease
LRVGENNAVISRADRPLPPRSEWRAAILYNISPGYLEAAGTRLLSGRDFNGRDREGTAPVALVNDALVHLLYPRQNPLGKHLRLRNQPVEIVGVVETGKYESLGEDPHPAVFLPIAQNGTTLTTLVARSRLPASQATDLLRKAVLDLDPTLTLFNTGSLRDQLAMPLFPARAAAVVLGAFGVLAMVLAATGLFALVAYSVSRRTREIGIRMALGARPANVLSSLLRSTVACCIAGVALGTAAAWIAGRLLSSILYGISPHDPAAYAAALVLVCSVALLAGFQPAARAVRVDPARTLREQ